MRLSYPLLTRLAAVSTLTLGGAYSQAQRALVRDGVVIKEADVRGLLPADGELIEKGKGPGEYFGFALGREVHARGKQGVQVSDRPIGERGFALRDGYIELNIGAHAEKEREGAVRNRKFGVDLAARVKLGLDDKLNIHVEIEWLSIQGDDLKSKLVVAFAKRRFEEAVQAQARAFADRLNAKIQKKLPDGPRRVTIRIKPGRIVVAPQGA